MLDPLNHMLPPPSSPTNSSVSSSDFDTESTGSFFHDRSTTLGTLMGVTFPAITAFRTTSRGHVAASAPSISVGNSSKKKKTSAAAERRWRRMRRWWTLCRDGEAKPASLGEFLEVERRFGDVAIYDVAAEELEGIASGNGVNGRVLFADGRVLPPAVEGEEDTAESGVLCRFPVSLTGICSGGVG